jgi:starvation-inducible DNA-binding protein
MSKATAVLSPSASVENMSIGISADDRGELSKDLTDILTSTYQLLIKTHVYHWNVVGPMFHSLHVMLEEQYNDLFAAADVIAERIRALGHLAPVEGSAPAKGVMDSSAKAATAHDMVNDLIGDHEKIVRLMRKAANSAADKGDAVTEDMLVARLTFHEKILWMLRAILTD